jgi:hypothetical protein
LKALYGLKQAAHAWYEKWVKILLSIGLKPTNADPCLFEGMMNESRFSIGLSLMMHSVWEICNLHREADHEG